MDRTTARTSSTVASTHTSAAPTVRRILIGVLPPHGPRARCIRALTRTIATSPGLDCPPHDVPASGRSFPGGYAVTDSPRALSPPGRAARAGESEALAPAGG